MSRASTPNVGGAAPAETAAAEAAVTAPLNPPVPSDPRPPTLICSCCCPGSTGLVTGSMPAQTIT